MNLLGTTLAGSNEDMVDKLLLTTVRCRGHIAADRIVDAARAAVVRHEAHGHRRPVVGQAPAHARQVGLPPVRIEGTLRQATTDPAGRAE